MPVGEMIERVHLRVGRPSGRPARSMLGVTICPAPRAPLILLDQPDVGLDG